MTISGTRREFLAAAAASVVTVGCRTALSPSRRKLLIYNEDNSAYACGRKFGGPPTEAGLRDYIRRISAGGAVTHFFACPNAMRANWDSRVMEPIWAGVDRPGINAPDWQRTLKAMHDAGIDLYSVWADETRRCGLSFWLSIRMNDVHNVDDPTNMMHSAFWRDHPELRRVPSADGRNWTDLALDYSHREVRDYWKAFLAEAFGRYDIDGLELDWMRFTEHLPPGRASECSWCLDEIMAEARRLADAASLRLGHKVLVGARVSSRPETAIARGTDFATWARKGWIDWLVPCNFWRCADFNLPYAEWARLVDGTGVTVVPGLDNGLVVNGRRRGHNVGEYSLFADRMYRQGAPGIYLFNPFDNKPEVWKALVSEGLPPSLVAMRAKGVTATDEHD